MAGKKTYIAAAAMAIYAVVGCVFGIHSSDTMIQLLLNAAGIAGLRHGITNDSNK
jgi:hypothetical protein